MSLDFPASPSIGAQYPASPVPGVPTYTWDGEKWTTQGGAIATGGLPATALPLIDATPALVGTATKYAREDHVHPTDTSRAAASALPVAATAAEYLANSAPTKMLTSGAVWSAAIVLGLTDAPTVTPDFSQGLDFLWQLAGAGRTLANPAFPKKGQKGCILLVQTGAGNMTITSWGAYWKFPGGTKPVLSTASGSVDLLSFWVYDPTFIVCNFQAAFA
jgi:hypothetical protein